MPCDEARRIACFRLYAGAQRTKNSDVARNLLLLARESNEEDSTTMTHRVIETAPTR